MEPMEPMRPMQQSVRPVEPVVVESTRRRAAQVVYFIFGVLEALLVLRLLMKLLGANPSAGFSQLVYGITGPFVALFQGVFPNATGGRSELELATLLAIIVYALVAWGIVQLVYLLSSRRQPLQPM